MIRAAAIAVIVCALAAPARAGDDDNAVYALVITNNRSLELARPDLQYADDDGAKYYELFTMLTGADRVALLTELDGDTARLFPSLADVVQPPTKDNVTAAAAAIAARTSADLDAGTPVQVYVVFAGHGDVDRGRGFLELADGAFTSDDLAALLDAIPSTATHVILDSCNSFFVINPRKAGGRRFSTPRDAADKIARRLPRVGVFLSTSAEAEVYEWSELQSGIFSHAVRSGLSGAADADGDGAVSYQELEAFVHVSSQEVRNPLFRPTVFASPPGGSDDAPIVALAGATGATLALDRDRAVRVTVRDADELRWIDTYKEAGVDVTLRLPPRLAAAATVEELAVSKAGAVVVRRSELVDGARTDVDIPSATRGAADLFRMLYTHPFGPKAVAEYRRGRNDAPLAVFGISREDNYRMTLLLRHTAGVDRQQKFAKSGALMTGSLLAVGVGAWLVDTADEATVIPERPQQRAGWTLAVGGLLGAAYSGWWMLQPSHGERAYRRFRRDLDDPNVDAAQAVANAELNLYVLQQSERRWRKGLEILGWSGAAVSALGLASNELWGPDEYHKPLRLVLAGGVITGVVGALILRSNITPVERMVEIWRDDPGLQRFPRLTVLPVGGGGLLHYQREF
jgi:hypothetical protein